MIARSEPSFIALDGVLALEKGAYSNLCVDPAEGVYFYRFLEKRTDKTLPLEKLMESQEWLSQEARCSYFKTLIPSFKHAA